MSSGAARPRSRLAGRLFGVLLKVLWTAFVVATPALGVWGGLPGWRSGLSAAARKLHLPPVFT